MEREPPKVACSCSSSCCCACWPAPRPAWPAASDPLPCAPICYRKSYRTVCAGQQRTRRRPDQRSVMWAMTRVWLRPCSACQFAPSKYNSDMLCSRLVQTPGGWARARRSLLPVRSRAAVVPQANMYSFSQVEPKVTGRQRIRAVMRRQAREHDDIVNGLTNMTDKQLEAITHLTGEEIISAVRIAAKLPRSNQGRKRQESLVAKLIRTQLDDDVVDKLVEAVAASRTSNSAYVDRDVQALVEHWKAGILASDQEVMEEVISTRTRLAAAQRAASKGSSEDDDGMGEGGAWGEEDDGYGDADDAEGPKATRPVPVDTSDLPTPQQLRALARQVQQLAAEANAQAAAAAAAAAAAQQEALAGGAAGAGTGAKAASGAKADNNARQKYKQLVRKLDKQLKQLAALSVSLAL